MLNELAISAGDKQLLRKIYINFVSLRAFASGASSFVDSLVRTNAFTQKIVVAGAELWLLHPWSVYFLIFNQTGADTGSAPTITFFAWNVGTHERAKWPGSILREQNASCTPLNLLLPIHAIVMYTYIKYVIYTV